MDYSGLVGIVGTERTRDMLGSLSTYSAADAKLGNRDSRKIGNNTYLQRRDAETIAIRLHSTDIITFHADGRTVLDSGGWLTVTTKDRMNSYAPCGRIYSVRGRWFVTVGGDAVPYFDGITFAPDGSVMNPQDGPDTASEDRENARIRRQIAAYVKLYTGERIAELIEGASDGRTDYMGDCLFCQANRSDGGSFGGTDHLLSHIEEGYTMLSLALAALTSHGYTSPGLTLQVDRDGSMTRRAITRYLRKALLSGVAVQ